MPWATFDIKRAGLAEQFIQNLNGNIPTMLTQLTEEIKNDIAAHAPKRKVFLNPKQGDIPLAQSFAALPAQQVGESTWEAYITSEVPAKARALEYGSGVHRMGSSYEITPKRAKLLHFYWENAPGHMGGPGWYSFYRVSHPGVAGQFYINETLRVWRPAIAQRFGQAVRMSAVSGGWMPGLR